jgi:hypothetical protein
MTTKTVTVQLQIAVWSCVPQGARDHGGLSNRMTVSRNGTGTRAGTGFIWPVAGCCEHGNESSGSTKGGEFLD